MICKWCGRPIVQGWEKHFEQLIAPYCHKNGYYTCVVAGVTHSAEPREEEMTNPELKEKARKLLMSSRLTEFPTLFEMYVLAFELEKTVDIEKEIHTIISIMRMEPDAFAAKEHLYQHLDELEANIPCGVCEGTGRFYPGMDLDDIDCPRCKGTGKRKRVPDGSE